MSYFVKQVIDLYRFNRQQTESRAWHEMAIIKAEYPDLMGLKEEIYQLGLQMVKCYAIKSEHQAEDYARYKDVKHLKELELQKLETALGLQAGYGQPQYKCRDCQDSGLVEARRCHCFKANLAQVVKYGQLEEPIRNVRLGDFKLDKYSHEISCSSTATNSEPPLQIFELLYKLANLIINDYDTQKQQFCDADLPNLLISGATGIGKTFLAGAMVNELRAKGAIALFVTADFLFNMMQELNVLNNNFRPNLSRLFELNEFEEFLFNCDFLVIDDLGTEALNNNLIIPTLLNILNLRQKPLKRTLITTNLDLKTLADKYDERISSRLNADFCHSYIVDRDLRF